MVKSPDLGRVEMSGNGRGGKAMSRRAQYLDPRASGRCDVVTNWVTNVVLSCKDKSSISLQSFVVIISATMHNFPAPFHPPARLFLRFTIPETSRRVPVIKKLEHNNSSTVLKYPIRPL